MGTSRNSTLAGILLVLSGCSGTDDSSYDAPFRLPGERAPLSAACDDLDPLRCLLPWPSNTFTVADPSTETGLRLRIEASSLVLSEDDPAFANLADGFSRVTPLVTAFPGKLAALSKDEKPVRLFAVGKDGATDGKPVPLRIEVKAGENIDGEPESFLFAYPLRPLLANTDYVAVVLDSLKAEDGANLQRTRAVELGLDFAAPSSQHEANLRAYHAPLRSLLAEVDIDPSRVLRAWDFTTRSGADATGRLLAMREASVDVAKAGTVSVVIDEVFQGPGETLAAIVEGRVTDLPSYLDENGSLVLDAEGLPIATGTHEAPFRVVIPRGEGDYRFVMYGHGTGGNFHDDIFDADLGELGIGKVGIQLYGWTDKEVLGTFGGLSRGLLGVSRAVAPLMQAIADGAAIEAAMEGVLGEALAAPMVGDVANPAEGRRPDASTPVWVGGSLGGTMSILAVGASPEARHGVANVPGAAWTHFVPGSKIFDPIRVLLRNAYGSDLDTDHSVSMSQGIWDEIDGASYIDALAAKSAIFLVQESMEDPILPNAGNQMAAVVVDAIHVGKALSPIEGLSEAEEAIGRSGTTQYRVPDTGPFDVHGFASRNTPAGIAAREQIRGYLKAVHAGAPRIEVPPGCLDARCDFSGL